MPKIREVRIKNFRSIKATQVAFSDLGVLVGNNDCGKSNILRALNLFFNGETDPGTPFSFDTDFNRFSGEKKRAHEISIEVVLELPANYRTTNGDIIVWKKTWRSTGLWGDLFDYNGYRKTVTKKGNLRLNPVKISAKSNVHSLLRKIEFEYIPAIRTANFFRQLRGRIYGVISQISEGKFRDKSSAFEKAISENVSLLIDDIGADLKEKAQLRLPNDLSQIFESLDFLSGEKSISLNNRGDGIKGRYIPLILKFIAEKKADLQVRGAQPYTFIWAYEEPENNLEFLKSKELAETFARLANENNIQVLLTTHSPIFYNLKTSTDLCTVGYVSLSSPEQGTVVTQEEWDPQVFDERMGVMPIVAPYIQDAQRKIDEAITQIDDLKKQQQHLNFPTIFVEGETEYKIFEKVLSYAFPSLKNKILLVCPPARAGANYVANMLIAWEHQTKHKPTVDRSKAAGVVDVDNEGAIAGERLSNFGSTKFIKTFNPAPNDGIKNAKNAGFDIPIGLEETWPKSVWEEAAALGFLEPRDLNNYITPSITQELLARDVPLSSLIAKDWEIFCKNMPKADKKTLWANHILKKPKEEFLEINKKSLGLIKEILSYLGFTT